VSDHSIPDGRLLSLTFASFDGHAVSATVCRWRSAQEEAMRYLWEEVRQLREWKAARMEADSYLQSSPDASANRELSQMRVRLKPSFAAACSELALACTAGPSTSRNSFLC
jgi:hypothetical protein